MSDQQTTPDNPQSSVGEETELLFSVVSDPHLLTPVVLIGASALIPVFFLDDAVKAYLERRLLRALAEREGQQINKTEVQRLTRSPSGGCCAKSCLLTAVVYPLRRMLRKVLFFLEIKRAVDQATVALAEAWLFRLALRRGLWSTGQDLERADALREVMRSACHSQGVKPLEVAFSQAFEGTKSTLSEFALKFAKQETPDEEQVAQTVEKLEEQQSDQMAGITQRLNDSLSEVSVGYLDGFAQLFEQQLAEAQAKI